MTTVLKIVLGLTAYLLVACLVGHLLRFSSRCSELVSQIAASRGAGIGRDKKAGGVPKPPSSGRRPFDGSILNRGGSYSPGRVATST